MKILTDKQRILYLTVLYAAIACFATASAKSVDDHRTAYKQFVNHLKISSAPTTTDIFNVVKLSRELEKDYSSTREADPEAAAQLQALLKNVLTLRGNMAAQMGNYDELVSAAANLKNLCAEDTSYRRFNEYIDMLTPRFTSRLSGFWVSSICDENNAPMFAMSIAIDDEKNEHEAFFHPYSQIYNSPHFKDCIYYISSTQGVEYTPSKKRLKMTFKAGKPTGGNTELAKSLSDAGERISSRTTEGIAIANRNKPLSGSNIAQQVVSESAGRILQGVAREMAVSKINENEMTIELYELCPGVLQADLDFQKFVHRSDGESYIDEFIHRSFLLYKVSVWDQGDFASSYGQYGADISGNQKLAFASVDEIKASNLDAYDLIRRRIDYWRERRIHDLRYDKYDGSWRGLMWSNIESDITNYPRQYYPDFAQISFPGFKEASYMGSFRFRKTPDFFNSPMFLMEILEGFDNGNATPAGVHYKTPWAADDAHNRYLKTLKDIAEPKEGVLNYNYKNRYWRNYEGGFRNYKFDGHGAIRSDRHGWDGSLIEEGTYKNGKLQK